MCKLHREKKVCAAFAAKVRGQGASARPSAGKKGQRLYESEGWAIPINLFVAYILDWMLCSIKNLHLTFSVQKHWRPYKIKGITEEAYWRILRGL